jgi:RimJ/RimL family protein N-acetyltransferase
VEKRTDDVVGGLSIRLLPPYEEDLELGCQLAPAAWRQGYATEASHALMHWAFRVGAVDELYAVARPGNQRAVAAAKRLGMEWVGETEKYYDLNLQVYRLRASELDVTGLGSPDLSVQAVRRPLSASGLARRRPAMPIRMEHRAHRALTDAHN